MFYYWAFGLKVAAEIEFPELYPISEEGYPDVIILLGNVPAEIQVENGFKSDHITIGQHLFLLHIKGVGSYFVEEGSRITISVHSNASFNEVRLFCLSNAFAAMLHQRKLIPLHAAGFIFKDKVVMLLGPSGVGKSTTLAALMKKGYAPFSDDICIPHKSGSVDWFVTSSYPMLKYWENTMAKLDIVESKEKFRLRTDINKFGIFFHEQFTCEPHRIKLLILLKEDLQSASVTLETITGIEAFRLLHAEAYRGEYLEYENMIQEQFNLISALANDIPAVSITRPATKDSMDEVAGLIESLLLN
jgi:hypothetical protein